MWNYNHKYRAHKDTPLSVHAFYYNVCTYNMLKDFSIISTGGGHLMARVDNIDWFTRYMSITYPKLINVANSNRQSGRFNLQRRVLPYIHYQFRNDSSKDDKYRFLDYKATYRRGLIEFEESKINELKIYKIPLKDCKLFG